MRLWHEDLIPHLPRQQLLGLHREVCGMRGKGWGQNHSTVNYVWDYSQERLVAYHVLVMLEMKDRGYNVSVEWWEEDYRGKNCDNANLIMSKVVDFIMSNDVIYPEHDDDYLRECLRNLASKGVDMNRFKEVIPA